ncbi:MAG: beta strand repeat-containing protein, partial [Bacteroidia bacterium]
KNQNMTITATVTNVTAANQVNVMFNGTAISNFGFTLNGTTATITFPVTLNAGNNAVSITGTNSVGSDVAECQIIYTVLVPTVNPPKVTITNPANCPHNTKSKSMTITATVTNVTAANQVNVVFNGTAVSNFTFTMNRNVATVSFPVSLNVGNNPVSITGTNSAGTDTKDCQIIYTVLVPTVNPPVVTYTTPSNNPYTSTTPNVSVTANVTNVTAANQVTVSVNNSAVTNFGFSVNGNNATVTFPVAINMGQNINCVVTGTNTSGTDSEQLSILYRPIAPAVNITNPATVPYTSSTAAFTFTATVLNVGSASEITVFLNNAPVSGFNYNMNSKVLTYSTTLNPGTTTFEVRASNAGGNASDNASVVFKQTPPRGPRVTITTPASSPSNSASASATVVATVQYVQSASEITVKRSNNTTVNFNYSGTTLTFTDNLNNGANTYTITAANANGSDSKSTTINYTAPAPGNGDAGRPRSVPASDPVIQLVTPGSLTATTSDQSYDVTMRTLGITNSSQITVKINGVTASSFNYAASTNTLTFTANLNNGVNTINVRIQNSVGYAEKELTVTFTAQSRNSGGIGNSGNSSGDTKNTSKPKTTTEKPKTTTEKPKTTTTEKPKTTTTTTTTPRGGESTPPKAGEQPIPPKQEAPAPRGGVPKL